MLLLLPSLQISWIPSSRFLLKIELAVSGFAVPPPHHFSPAPSAPLLPAQLAAKCVLVKEDAFVPPLAPLYCGSYLVLEWGTMFFCLQLGDRSDVVSVYRLKSAFSDEPISLALLPLHGCPAPGSSSGSSTGSTSASAAC